MAGRRKTKCEEDVSLLTAYARKAEALLRQYGIVESAQSVVIHVNESIPVSHIARCDQIFAAYVTLRQGGG